MKESGAVYISNELDTTLSGIRPGIAPILDASPELAAGLRCYVCGEPQGQCLRDMMDSDVRLTISSIAQQMTGMADRGEEDPTGYALAIAPGEDKQMRHDMRKMSGCGLVGRAIARFAGVYARPLCPPYRLGAAFNDLYELGRQTGALKTGPLPISHHGTLVTIGRGMRTHMLCFVGLDDHGKVWSVDGGQVDAKGKQCVLWRERQAGLVKTHNNGTGINRIGDREVIWWFDFTAPGLRELMKLDWRMPWRFGTEAIPRPARP